MQNRRAFYRIGVTVICALSAALFAGKSSYAQVAFGSLQKGKLAESSHNVSLQKGLYRITVTTDGFSPFVRVHNKSALQSATAGVGTEATLLYEVKTKASYRIVVLQSTNTRKVFQSGNYTLKVDQIVFKPAIKQSGELAKNSLTYDLESGQVYRVTVLSPVFGPHLRIVRKGTTVAETGVGRVSGKFSVADLYFAPTESAKYQMQIDTDQAGVRGRIGPAGIDYFVRVAKVKPALFENDKLATSNAKRNQSFVKPRTFKMEGGRTYTILMIASGFEPALVLQTAKKKDVQSSEENAVKNTASLIYRCKRGGEYRIVATSVEDGRTGPFQLIVIETKSKRTAK